MDLEFRYSQKCYIYSSLGDYDIQFGTPQSPDWKTVTLDSSVSGIVKSPSSTRLLYHFSSRSMSQAISGIRVGWALCDLQPTSGSHTGRPNSELLFWSSGTHPFKVPPCFQDVVLIRPVWKFRFWIFRAPSEDVHSTLISTKAEEKI
jgi:hypothetical protein